MFLKYLPLILVGLLFLFGSFMWVAESRVWGQSWAGLVLLCVGGLWVPMVKDALTTGHLQFGNFDFRYAHQPRLFWAAAILIAAAGVAIFIMGVWLLFFKHRIMASVL